MGTGWKRYIDVTSGQRPRALYLDAVSRFDRPQTAVDLGCGAGNESTDLLRRGWEVLAVDSDPAAIDSVKRRAGADSAKLSTRIAEFADLELPERHFVHAGFSLFFAAPTQFPRLWATIMQALPSGGRFAGQLLGERDDWATEPELTVHNAGQIAALCAGFMVERHTETAQAGPSLAGPKFWHLHELILRKVLPGVRPDEHGGGRRGDGVHRVARVAVPRRCSVTAIMMASRTGSHSGVEDAHPNHTIHSREHGAGSAMPAGSSVHGQTIRPACAARRLSRGHGADRPG